MELAVKGLYSAGSSNISTAIKSTFEGIRSKLEANNNKIIAEQIRSQILKETSMQTNITIGTNKKENTVLGKILGKVGDFAAQKIGDVAKPIIATGLGTAVEPMVQGAALAAGALTPIAIGGIVATAAVVTVLGTIIIKKIIDKKKKKEEISQEQQEFENTIKFLSTEINKFVNNKFEQDKNILVQKKKTMKPAEFKKVLKEYCDSLKTEIQSSYSSFGGKIQEIMFEEEREFASELKISDSELENTEDKKEPEENKTEKPKAEQNPDEKSNVQIERDDGFVVDANGNIIKEGELLE